MQCIRCGREQGPGVLLKGLCPDCYVETEKPFVIPEHIAVLVCASCGSVLRGKKWLKPKSDEQLLEFALAEHTSVREGVEVLGLSHTRGRGDERAFDVRVHARLGVGGDVFERDFATRVKIKHSLCDVCSRRAGSYFEAIVQVRAHEGPLDKDHQARIRSTVEEAVAAISAKEREVFMSKAEEIHGGLDFYLSSTSAAQRIAAQLRDDLGATLLRSGKIAGVKDGNELQRTTFAVRLPRFLKGDVMLRGERIYRVAKVHPRSVVVTDLETGIQENKPDEWVKRATLPGSEAAAQDAVVVSLKRDEVQVLDPVSYATVTLSNWPRYEPGLDKVPVVRYRGRLYLAG